MRWTTPPRQRRREPMPAVITTTRGPITSFATQPTQRGHHQDFPVNLLDKPITTARALVICLVLVAVCYANSITNAFILDDILIVAANERIRHIAPQQFLFQSYW